MNEMFCFTVCKFCLLKPEPVSLLYLPWVELIHLVSSSTDRKLYQKLF